MVDAISRPALETTLKRGAKAVFGGLDSIVGGPGECEPEHEVIRHEALQLVQDRVYHSPCYFGGVDRLDPHFLAGGAREQKHAVDGSRGGPARSEETFGGDIHIGLALHQSLHPVESAHRHSGPTALRQPPAHAGGRAEHAQTTAPAPADPLAVRAELPQVPV